MPITQEACRARRSIPPWCMTGVQDGLLGASARDGHSDRRSVGRGLVISQFRGTWKYGAFSAASTGRRGNPSADSRVAGASVFVQGLFGDQRAASHSDVFSVLSM